MLHSNFDTNFIGMQGWVYSHPTLRNLVRTNDSMVNRPQSDVHGSISVSIANMSAFAFEQCLGGSVALTDTSTFVASSACVSGVNFYNFNLFPDGDCLYGREQLEIGYSVDLPICFSVELASSSPAVFQFFNGDATVELFGYSDYFPSNLEALGFGVIALIGFKFSQILPCSMRTFVSNTLQFVSPFINDSLFIGDFPSQIELLEYSAILDDAYGCQGRRPDIYAKNTLSSNWFWEVLLENDLDYPRTVLFKKHDRLEIPSIFEEGIESLPATILFYRQSKATAFNQSNSKHWIIPLSLAEFIISFGETNSDFFKFNIKHPFFLVPDFTSCSLNNLSRESSLFTNRGVGYAM